ncbi:HDOD domain-containing protein [Comamonadaceae bacterium G21597-S1]|nr:HDOD domain-containing protein [Comamonadaceae bacterium G21597-S1]
MTPELTQKLAAAVDRMPAFPRSVQQILELTRDVNCSPKDLVRVIDHDPVVMVKILRVVNSAYYSLPKQITSVNHAVVYMGFNSLKNLALSIAAIGMLPKEGVPGFDAHQYLLHSLTTANIAKMLAPRVGNVDANDCFIAGLLHDFGKVVFAQFMPQEFKQALMMADWGEVSLYQTLREVIGTDHAVVGGMLVEKWRFPAPLVETIRHQHVDDLLDTEMIACVFTANQISKKLGFGAAGNPSVEALPPFIAQRVGGDLDAVIASLGDLDRMYEEAMVFANA